MLKRPFSTTLTVVFLKVRVPTSREEDLRSIALFVQENCIIGSVVVASDDMDYVGALKRVLHH